MRNHVLARAGWRTPRGRPDLPGDRRLPDLYRVLADRAGDDAPSGELARDAPLALVEAALLAADEPLTPRRLAHAAGLADAAATRAQVARLRALYDADGTAFQVVELAGGFQLRTRPEYHPWLVRLRRSASDPRLTPAARETLAIVAYRQPVTRADLEGVRGAQSSEVLRHLMEKGLVRIAGRDDSLGRPVLYGTTKKFLQLYGLRSLRDLPPVDELKPAGKKAEPEGQEDGQ